MQEISISNHTKVVNLDAANYTVHEMARDKARHDKALEGLLKRYFG